MRDGREPEEDVFAGDPTADLERELLAEFEASFSPPEPEPHSPGAPDHGERAHDDAADEADVPAESGGVPAESGEAEAC